MARLKINNSRIDWMSSDSHYFFNPKHPKNLKELGKKLPFFKGHIYLFTSGGSKICFLSKEAFLHSAQSVNQHLQVEKKDRWLISLPLFHVGGLSILARAFVGHFQYKTGTKTWNVEAFKKDLDTKKISFSSLVPAQVYDLVKYNIKSPKTLRALIVGGEDLPSFLYKKARRLKWPILLSYGLTEAGSQVACSPLSCLHKNTYPEMKILNHIQIQKNHLKTKIKSKSLLRACFDLETKRLYDPKDSKGWLELPDQIRLNNKSVIVEGRKEEQIKIAGEIVNIQKLKELLKKEVYNPYQTHRLVALPHPREGFNLALLTDSFNENKLFCLVKNFNKKVLPFEKIKSIYFVADIKKSSLFKTHQKNLLQHIGF